MTLLEDLQDQIAKGQVIVIVGVSISIGATGNKPCASWTGLLHHGVDHCAEKIATKLGAPEGGEYRANA